MRVKGQRHEGVARFVEIGASLIEQSDLDRWIKNVEGELEKLPSGTRLYTGLKEGLEHLLDIVEKKNGKSTSKESEPHVLGIGVHASALRGEVEKWIQKACQAPAFYGPNENPEVGLFNVEQEDGTIIHMAVLPSISLRRDSGRVGFLVLRNGVAYKSKDFDSSWAYSPESPKPKFVQRSTPDCDARFYWAVRLQEGDIVKFWLNDPTKVDPMVSKGDLLDRYRYFELNKGNFYLIPAPNTDFDF